MIIAYIQLDYSYLAMDIIRLYYNRFKNNPPPLDKVQKYMAVARYSYFLSCFALAIVVWRSYTKYREKEEEEAQNLGDTSAAHRRLRERGIERGTIYTFKLDSGLVKEEFDREVYLRELEKKALEKAEETKRLALAESQELLERTNGSSK